MTCHPLHPIVVMRGWGAEVVEMLQSTELGADTVHTNISRKGRWRMQRKVARLPTEGHLFAWFP